MCIFAIVAGYKALTRSIRRMGRFLGIAFGQLRDDLVSYVTVVPILLFLFAVVYRGIFSAIEGFSALHAAIVNPWTFLFFSLCHYALVLAVSPAEQPAMRDFSAIAGLDRSEARNLQRVWFIARNWHLPFVDLLLFLPIAASWRAFAAALCLFVLYSLAAYLCLGSVAFALKTRGSGAASPRAARGRKKLGPRASLLAASFLKRGDVLLTAALVLVLELAVAVDLSQHHSSAAAGDLSDPKRWLLFFSFCASVLAQAGLAEACRFPKGYYRLFPISFSHYARLTLTPIFLSCSAVMAPLFCCMAFSCPGQLLVALPLLAAFSFVSFALAQWSEANRVAVAIALFVGCLALSVLTVFSPFASLAIAAAAAILAALGGRRRFLFDEVIQ